MSSAQRENPYSESLPALMTRQFGLITTEQAGSFGLSSQSISRRVESEEWARVLPRVYRHTAAPVVAASDGARGDALGGRGLTCVPQRGSRLVAVRRCSRAKSRALGAASPACSLPAGVGAPWHPPGPRRSHHARRDTDHHRHANADRHGRPPRGSTPSRGHRRPDPSRPRNVRTGSVQGSARCARRAGPVAGAWRSCSISEVTVDRSSRISRRWPGRSFAAAASRSPRASTGSPSTAAAIASTSPGPSVKVGLECEGWEHHGGLAAWGKDRTRLAELVAADWRILPLTWDVCSREPARVVQWIRDTLANAA